jgi:hypothetical protein
VRGSPGGSATRLWPAVEAYSALQSAFGAPAMLMCSDGPGLKGMVRRVDTLPELQGAMMREVGQATLR